MKSVTFRARITGDGECFFWGQVPPEDMKTVLGDQKYEENLRLEREFHEEMGRDPTQTPPLDRLYPGEIWHQFGCKTNRKYRFTIQVEEIS